jgi:glycosyltransferase involved in cell wall biosynthesis
VRYLFVHQNFPGQFVHLVKHLLAAPDNEVVFITEPNKNVIEGVRKIVYKSRQAARTTHPAAQDLESAVLRAEAVAETAVKLRALGFTPDIMIGHHGWGELLNVRDVWPNAALLGYFEYYYRATGSDVNFDPEFPSPVSDFPRIRAKNTINLLALDLGGHGHTPTEWQRSTYPEWAQAAITLLPEGTNLDICRPDPSIRRAPLDLGRGVILDQTDTVLTYVARDLEPYRGFHVMMRALPAILRERRDLRVVIVGGDGVSYGVKPPVGTWREVMLAEVGGQIDRSRVHFVGRLDYALYTQVLQRSDAHVYLTYPFVASWSLREALASGCAVVGSDTAPVAEFITDGENGVLTPFLDSARLARRVLDLLEDSALRRRIRAGARRFAERRLAMADYLAGCEALIARMTGRNVPARAASRPARPRRSSTS